MNEFKKGVEVRLIIHNILFAIKYKNFNFDYIFEKVKKREDLKTSDYNLINDVVLSSMRLHLYVNKIINLYTKKKPKKDQYILLLSSITQLVYLNYQNYAVINCAVEIAKLDKIIAVPGFINSVLKNIDQNKSELKKIVLEEKQLSQITNYFLFDKIDRNKKIEIFESIAQKPHTHLVFKKKINNNKQIIKITNFSGILKNKISINSLDEFKNGDCWVQDFGAMLPLYLTKKLKNLNVLDMCAAPGGKTFQLINSGAKVHSIEKEHLRGLKLKENLNRLKFNSNIKIIDVLKLKEDKKFNLVVLDAPCSSIGTIRRNPDILFKNKKVNINQMYKNQINLLEKANRLLLVNGTLIYIVCSFVNHETYKPIMDFLKKNKNFSIERFNSEKKYSSLIDSNGFIKIFPQKFSGTFIDGFFAAKLKKNA